MRAGEQLIFPGMPVSALLNARPAALRLLETWGIDPWLDPHAHLDALAAAKQVPWPEFEAALDELPYLDEDRDWEDTTLPDLLDHLIADHRDMLDRIVPALRFELARIPATEKDPPLGSDAAWNLFADGLEAAVAAGATAVIHPGGSIRDTEVIAAADAAGIAMVFTGMRHFRH